MRILDIESTSPAKQIVYFITKIYQKGMTTTSGGNISIIDDDGDVWITPSAIDKGKLNEDDIVCIKKDGSIEGKHKPSSEYPFHLAIYRERADIKAVIHAHPPAIVSFSIARQIPKTIINPYINSLCGVVGYAEYGLPGSDSLGEKIAKEFLDKKTMCVIMENHGTVLGGENMMDAYIKLETLEICSQIIINANSLGKPHYLLDSDIDKYNSSLSGRKTVKNLTEYSSDEEFLRQYICDIAKRMYQQELSTALSSAISIRLNKNDFIIIPSDIPIWSLVSSDIVSIKEGESEKGKIVPKTAAFHQEIYRKNPHINSIIQALPTHLMAFGATNIKPNVRTIPESWIFLQDIPIVSFESHNKSFEETAGLFGKETPALLIANESFVVTGNELLQTFDKLEVAEFSAKSLIMTSQIGELIPINDEQIEELREKFLK